MDGYIEKLNEEERFSFTWEGSDEMDEASGSGWIKLAVPNEIEGGDQTFGSEINLASKPKKFKNESII